MGKLQRVEITYYDEDRRPDVVVVGLYEVEQAERKYGKDSITADGDLNATRYAAFLGMQRAGLVPRDADYEGWCYDVALVDQAEPGESVAPPGR